MANALSPAQVISVDIDEEHRIASVTVPERMLSLAIGREGQNARLAARLTGWRIDIRSDVSVAEAKAAAEAPEGATDAVATGEAAVAVTTAPAKPKRVTKKAAAEAAAVDAVVAGDAATDAVAKSPAKPKRVTKKAAAAAPAVTEPAADAPVEAAAAPAKPKRAAKKKAEVTEEVAS